jgi:Ca2+-binding RTX toxin-like protein
MRANMAAPAGYVEFNGHYYTYVKGLYTHAEAEAAAARSGGYLATITSAEENAYLANLVAGQDLGAWLGGSGHATEGTWQWTQGPEAGSTISGYTNWNPGEPSGVYNGVDEDYLHMMANDSRWNDAAEYFNTMGYFVEINGSSPPTDGAPVTPAPPSPEPIDINGTDGRDYLSGNSQRNVIHGLAGNDTVTGGFGNDLIYGNQGDEAIYGNQGDDTVYGGQGADSAYGGQGNDAVYGNFGADAIYGNFGNDTLYGGQDNDLLFGGQDSDLLVGGLGNDTLAGGIGADIYRFGGNSGADLILGFSSSEGDKLDFGGQTFTFSDDGNGGTRFTLSGGGSVDLAGVAPAAVTPSFFA